MRSRLPLDDEIGLSTYIDGSTWRLSFDRASRGFALKRVSPDIDFDLALQLIEMGQLRWQPPAEFEPLGEDDSIDSVQQHVALLVAFRRSPMCVESSDWARRARIEARLAEARTWLARRTLTSGE
jgi:hypothetical protein